MFYRLQMAAIKIEASYNVMEILRLKYRQITRVIESGGILKNQTNHQANCIDNSTYFTKSGRSGRFFCETFLCRKLVENFERNIVGTLSVFL